MSYVTRLYTEQGHNLNILKCGQSYFSIEKIILEVSKTIEFLSSPLVRGRISLLVNQVHHNKQNTLERRRKKIQIRKALRIDRLYNKVPVGLGFQDNFSTSKALSFSRTSVCLIMARSFASAASQNELLGSRSSNLKLLLLLLQEAINEISNGKNYITSA